MEKREQHTNFPNRQSARKSAAIPAPLPGYGRNTQKPLFFEELFLQSSHSKLQNTSFKQPQSRKPLHANKLLNGVCGTNRQFFADAGACGF